MLAILKRKLRLISLNHSLTKTMAIITAPGAMTERKYSRWNGSVDKSTRQTVRLFTGRSDGDVSDRRVARESEVTACGWRRLSPTGSRKERLQESGHPIAGPQTFCLNQWAKAFAAEAS